MHLVRLATTLLEDEESARNNNVLACNFSKYSPIVKKTDGLSSIPFLISLLTSSPHREYVSAPALQVIVNRFFSGINVSQGSEATYAACGGTHNNRFAANWLWEFFSVRILKVG